MKNLTLTLPDKTYKNLRIVAAQHGKSMSKYVASLLERQVDKTVDDDRRALDIFLSGPLLDLTDENGKAPSRDQIYDR